MPTYPKTDLASQTSDSITNPGDVDLPATEPIDVTAVVQSLLAQEVSRASA